MGGVGHMWFKRLFIDRKFTEFENGEQFTFIPSLVFDNKFLMENNPDYVDSLRSLPEKQRQAFLYGDWNVFEGQFFPFDEAIHVFDPKNFKGENEPFILERHWNKYRSRDYGYDMLACIFFAKDDDGTFYAYKEIHMPNLDARTAGNMINSFTLPEDNLTLDIAPPDMWNRQSTSGRSIMDIWELECGQRPIKANNDKVQGCALMLEMLQINPATGKPRLMISENCPNLILSLKMLQFDDKNPNVYANNPHELTHSADAFRYMSTSWTFDNTLPQQIYDTEKIDYIQRQYLDYVDRSRNAIQEGGWFNDTF